MPPTPTPWAENPQWLQLAPAVAVAGDSSSAIISGTAPTSCVPTYVSHERLDTGYLPIDLLQESGDACQLGEAPWLLTVDLGQLAAGSHIVEVYITLDGVRTRHAAQLLYINPQPLPPPQTVPPDATAAPPPTPTPYFENGEALALDPPNPAPDAPFSALINGEWSSSCVPTLSGVTVAETGYVTVSLTTQAYDDQDCLTVLTPWTANAVIPALPAGSYLLVVEISDQGAIRRYAARSLYLPAR